mmetsp:Transcript_8225/g.21200  ORF Transcript_8225/g.21200 Transcript_8225/m.21200 type:complete len:88 (-) Transcript_8225:394-657(-)
MHVGGNSKEEMANMLNPRVARCYPIWMDFYSCMVETDKPSKCIDLREDYFECLHHRKEISRVNRIGKEIEKQEGGSPSSGNEDGHVS